MTQDAINSDQPQFQFLQEIQQLLSTNQLNCARRRCHERIKHFPDSPILHYALSQILERGGQNQSALRAFQVMRELCLNKSKLSDLGSESKLFSPRPGIDEIASRHSFALNGLDSKLNSYLDFDNGFFVEAGANNGISQSNSLYFELYRGWRGLLVEPVPHLASECKSNRPRAIVENYALVSDSNISQIEMEFCGLMSLVKGAMKSEKEEREHIKNGCKVQGLHAYSLVVPATTLSTILIRHQIKHIDLLSLDVEGFELEVLKGIDFTKHRPMHLLIEARYREEIEEYLDGLYTPIVDLSHHDVLYKVVN
jgi:FkbM family methyltransferase